MVKVVFVLGAPGSGKGTLCKKLVDDGGLLGGEGLPSPLWVTHVSVGDMLRRLEAQGALSAEQARRTREQELLGGHELVALLKEEVAKVRLGAKPTGEGRWGESSVRLDGPVLVIDGFPRNMEQVEAFREKMGHVNLIVSLRCPREVALERYLGRRDPTRPAGDEALFAKRFTQFEEENPKILEFYDRENPRHTIEVDVGSTEGIDHNYKNLVDALNAFPTQSMVD